MTAINGIFKKQPLIMALLLFIVGVLLGWFVMGWTLWPVTYVNGDISQLNPVRIARSTSAALSAISGRQFAA